MKLPKLTVVAYNIHCGGGLVILKMLFQSLANSNDVPSHFAEFVLNEKLQQDLNFPAVGKTYKVLFIRNNLFAKLAFEIKFFAKHLISADNKQIICLGNLPPLLPIGIKHKVRVFCQNRYFFLPLKNLLKKERSFKFMIKVLMWKAWFWATSKSFYEYHFQTNSMIKCFKSSYKNLKNFKLTPVFEFSNDHSIIDLTHQTYSSDFIYIASSEIHKNHKNLIKAWDSLGSTYKLYPKLILTISEQELSDLVAPYIVPKNIVCIGTLQRDDVLKLLSTSTLIYPSKFESFGLPLLEACCLKRNILASHSDYVFDVCHPSLTFDPESTDSIAACVAKYITDGISVPSKAISFVSSRTLWDFSK